MARRPRPQRLQPGRKLTNVGSSSTRDSRINRKVTNGVPRREPAVRGDEKHLEDELGSRQQLRKPSLCGVRQRLRGRQGGLVYLRPEGRRSRRFKLGHQQPSRMESAQGRAEDKQRQSRSSRLGSRRSSASAKRPSGLPTRQARSFKPSRSQGRELMACRKPSPSPRSKPVERRRSARDCQCIRHRGQGKLGSRQKRRASDIEVQESSLKRNRSRAPRR